MPLLCALTLSLWRRVAKQPAEMLYSVVAYILIGLLKQFVQQNAHVAVLRTKAVPQ